MAAMLLVVVLHNYVATCAMGQVKRCLIESTGSVGPYLYLTYYVVAAGSSASHVSLSSANHLGG